ncbi:Arf GTPase arf [Salix suchowensis]|nr:Arf GTPase arf [Salix suchowensis]
MTLNSTRPYWRCYFPNTSAIIYVIDSSDHDRLSTARTELLTMLSEEELKGVPLLVFCNKQDMEGALKPEEISEQLGLAGGEKSRPWSVRGSCATKGEGLEDGLDCCDNTTRSSLRESEASRCLPFLRPCPRSRPLTLLIEHQYVKKA